MDFVPVRLKAEGFGRLALAGAWELRNRDRRFGGFSALVVDQGSLLALTDNGAIARFPMPGMLTRSAVTIRDLPDGPGSKTYIWYRDSEALALDPMGRGWWVAFEARHELWLFDPTFTRGLKRIRLGPKRWPLNKGAEGLVALPGPELLIFVEDAGQMFRMRESTAVAEVIAGQRAGISDATILPDGRIATIERTFGVTGFRNSLAIIEKGEGGLRVADRFDLPAGILTNLEGVAAERGQRGSTRLWIISDDNFQRPLRTLLLAVDLPLKRRAG